MMAVGQSNRKAIGRVLTSMRRINSNVMGVALNEVRKDISDRYCYHGYCGKYYAKYHSRRRHKSQKTNLPLKRSLLDELDNEGCSPLR